MDFIQANSWVQEAKNFSFNKSFTKEQLTSQN